jgi:hypothetical protein
MKSRHVIQSLIILTGITASNMWLLRPSPSSSRACVRSETGNIVCGEMVPLPSLPVHSFSSAIVSSTSVTSVSAIQKIASLQYQSIQSNLLHKNILQTTVLQTTPFQSSTLSEPASQVVTAHGFRFELKGCHQSDARVTCHLLIQNLARTDRPLHLQAYKYPTHSRLISPTGEELHADQIQFGQKTHSQQVTAQLSTQVPLKASISFPAIPKTVNQATIVEVIYAFTELKYGMTLEKTLRFSNIQITPSPAQKPLAFSLHNPLATIALRPTLTP